MGLSQLLKDEEKSLLIDKLEGLYNDPKHGRVVKEAMAEFFKVEIPELAVEKRIDSATAEMRTELGKVTGELEERKIKEKIEREQAQLVKDGIVTEEELPAVSKLMVERGIGDYKTGAEFYRLQKQAAVPTPQLEHSAASLPSEKELFKDRNAWARKEAYKFFQERRVA